MMEATGNNTDKSGSSFGSSSRDGGGFSGLFSGMISTLSGTVVCLGLTLVPILL